MHLEYVKENIEGYATLHHPTLGIGLEYTIQSLFPQLKLEECDFSTKFGCYRFVKVPSEQQ